MTSWTKTAMNNKRWDIVDVVGSERDVTERQANPRAHARGFGASTLSTAALVLSVSFALSVPVVVPLTESTSEEICAIHRAPKQRGRPSAAGAEEARNQSGTDFVRARSGEGLARAF